MTDLEDFSPEAVDSAVRGNAPKPAPKQSSTTPALAAGRADLSNILVGLQSTLADAKEGSPLHQRTLRDIANIQGELSKIPGGAPQAAAAAPVDDLADFTPEAIHQAVKASGSQPPTAPSRVQAQPVAPADRMGKPDPEMELTAHIASSAVAPVVGGLAGGGRFLADLVRGRGLDSAVNAGVDTLHRTQGALTFQPQSQTGQQMAEGFDSPYNPVTWIPRAASWLGDKAGGALADAGAPGAGAVVNGALNGSQLLLPGAVRPAARKLSGLVNGADAPVRIEPTMDAPKPRYRIGPDGQPVLLQPTVPQATPGAAAVAVPVGGPSAVAVPKPSLEQASPALRQVVETAQAKGKPVNQAVLDRHLEADTLPVKVQLTEGQATLDPELISMEMNGRGKAKPTVSPDFYNQQGKALAQNLEVLRDRVSPNVTTSTAADHGQVLVDEYKGIDAAAREDISAKYKALEAANGGSLPLSGSDFVSAADAALTKINRARFLPPEVKTMLNDYREGGSMNFNDFENLRTILAAEGRKAARAGDGNAEAAIGAVRESLESLPMTQETTAIKPLADAARKAAKARFDKIKADPAYKAVTEDNVPVGGPSPLADKFVQNYIVNGKGAYVKNMKANLSSSPVAGETISRASLDYLADMAKADKETGKFLADRYGAGVRQLGPKLGDVFDPQTRASVEQLGRVAKYTSAQPKGSYVNNSGTLVGSLAEGTKNIAEGVANNAAFGVPIGTFVRKGAQHLSANKAAKKATAPGAGINSPD